MKRIVVFCLLCLSLLSLQGQNIRGLVVDSVSNAPLEMATVTLLRHGKPFSFAMTDAAGHFALKVVSMPGDRLSATYLGYARCISTIPAGKEVCLRMQSAAFTLREVQIRAGRIYGRQDTISYDIGRFADTRDNSLKDVLRKLPGVDIDRNGTLSYNGKAINRFTVEGIDLTGGRYNLITDNVKAKDVDKAEIIEHDQPVKALSKKVMTDNVGMNIKLKPEARDKWVVTLKPLLLAGSAFRDTRVGGSINALQIGKKQQTMYDGRIDRTGKDLSLTDRQLTDRQTYSPLPDIAVPLWIDRPVLATPIDDERLRFNSSQSWNMNRAFKAKSGSERRFTAGYYHATERQTTDNRSLYYLNGNEPTETDQRQSLRIRTDRLQMGFGQEINNDKAYGNEHFDVSASQINGWADIRNTGKEDIAQLVRQPEIDIANRYSRLTNYDKHTLAFVSVMQFSHAPSSLTVDGEKEKLTSTQWYADNNLTWMRKYGFLTQSYQAGISAERLSVNGGHTRFSFYLYPKWEYKKGNSTLCFRSLAQWERYAELNRSFFNVSPQLSLYLKSGFRSEWSLYAGFKNATGDWSSFVLPNYRSNYRTYYQSDEVVPRTDILYSGIRYSYKRPIQELFMNAEISVNQTRGNTMTDLQIADGRYMLHRVAKNNFQRSLQAGSEISKGFFAWHLKTKLKVDYLYNKGVQMSAGQILDYRNRQLTVEPQFIFSPSWGAISYEGSFGWTKSRIQQNENLEALLHWTQRLTLTKTIGQVDISLSGVHYRNELQASPTAHTFLADASVVWRNKIVRCELALHNLFNQRSYDMTTYSGISTSTDSYRLRPREITLELQFGL